jgi:5-formyltetrahydrofolate cyclo-ligase
VDAAQLRLASDVSVVFQDAWVSATFLNEQPVTADSTGVLILSPVVAFSAGSSALGHSVGFMERAAEVGEPAEEREVE